MNLLVVNKYYYSKGGVEQYITEAAEMLEAKGHRIIPFSSKDPRNWPNKYEDYFTDYIDYNPATFRDRIKAGLSWFRIVYSLKSARMLKKLLQDHKVDAANIFNIYYQMSPSVLNVLSGKSIPVILFVNDYYLFCINYTFFHPTAKEICSECLDQKYFRGIKMKCLKNSLGKSTLAVITKYFEKLSKIYLKKTDHFVVASEFMKKNLITYGVKEDRISKIYNPIQVSKYQDYSAVTGNYALYFGRFSPEKGLSGLIEVFARFRDDRFQLKIIGEGDEKSSLEELITRYGLEKRVELIPPKWGAELMSYLAKARFIIYPSIWPENSPMTVYQALASGKAVIAPATGGIPELIQNGLNGYLYPPGDKQKLAEIIEDVFRAEEAQITLLGKNAREYAVRNFDISVFYEKYISIVRSLAEKKSSLKGKA